MPNCHIGINLKDCPNEAILHELVHSYSTSYYTLGTYQAYSAIEEASVQYLTQEIAKREGINKRLTLYETDLKFAQRLLRVPMTRREEWLWGKVRKFAETIEQMMTATELMNNLTWEALEKWIHEN